MSPNIPASILIWMLIVLGLILFVLPRIPRTGSGVEGVLWGALFGLVVYGVYDLPLEIAMSLMIKAGTIILIGISGWAFLLFEILLNGTSLFNHANVRIPPGLDRVLRLFLVTPDMHRVHHSVIIRERNSNFGFNLPWWDLLFNTYRTNPRKGTRR